MHNIIMTYMNNKNSGNGECIIHRFYVIIGGNGGVLYEYGTT